MLFFDEFVLSQFLKIEIWFDIDFFVGVYSFVKFRSILLCWIVIILVVVIVLLLCLMIYLLWIFLSILQVEYYIKGYIFVFSFDGLGVVCFNGVEM